jgi:zinc/manganese transport system substrate-binding protein
MLNRTLVLVAVVAVALLVGGGAYADLNGGAPQQTGCSTAGKAIPVVAAENFWGSLASQVGGTHVNVTSIVTDPNADPHEYESNAANARALADACLVIVNGAGYDTWALSLVAASNGQHQTVLNVQELLGQPVDANPHFWYSPYFVNDTVKAVYRDLVSIDPADSSYFRQQYASLNTSLAVYNARIHEIANQFAGRKVAATEDIFVYLANATKLDLISPPAFMQAVAEGNDPPASSVATFQQELQNKTATLLVYNQQTVTPLTESMKSLAAQNGIPIVGVTETIQPPDIQFQVWMNAELIAIQNGLNAAALGQ